VADDVRAIRPEPKARGYEPARSRTENQQIKSLLLCQLSYGPIEDMVTPRMTAA
jgi:hypothetical protein